MAEVVPFVCWRPRPDIAAEVAAGPYDTFSRAEAAEEIATHPLSFLRIDKPAALYGNDVDEYDPQVYARAKDELNGWYDDGIFVADNAADEPRYFAYRLTQDDHTQTGIVACASVADYKNGTILRHENTREQKELDRVEHITALRAHTSPVLLTYPSQENLEALLTELCLHKKPLYDFIASDGVQHELWPVKDADTIERIQTGFAAVPHLYIADGHHRGAAAARVAELSEGTDNKETEFFLAVLFGSDQLRVYDYNRVVSDCGGLSFEELLAAVGELVDVELSGTEPYRPKKRGEYGMYVKGSWYKLSLRAGTRPADAVDGLDVALLHSLILEPILKIADPRTDPRISYVGGVRGLDELAKRASSSDGVAFALYPCSLEELFAVADADRLMPPKSTWFEPKPRSGLVIHRFDAPKT